MKKKIHFAIFAAIMIAAISAVTAKSTSTQETSDLVVASIEAVAQSESANNYGPSYDKPCAQEGYTKKLCRCLPGYPVCTETDCF